MIFIRDYIQFIEVGCASCGRKHTIQKDKYSFSAEGYSFTAPVICSCGQAASTASKASNNEDSNIFKTESNEFMKRNRLTTFKMLLVIGFVIVFFAGETVYMFNQHETEPKSAQHDTDKEVSQHGDTASKL